MERKVLAPAGGDADAVIARLAARQHRVVARRQLLAAGIGSEAIRHRRENARLYALYRGIYAVGVPQVDPNGRRLAAVLACGDAAVLSHRAATAHLGLLVPAPGPVDVIVPGSSPRRRPGIVVHATRSLPAAEVMRRQGIPCTIAERTLIDLAGLVSAPRLERAVEQAFALRLLGGTRMREALDRAGGRRGLGTLRELLSSLLDELALTRSELERRFLRLVRSAGLPMPKVNRHRASHRVDFHWPPQQLVVETDGRATHDTPYGFHRDRARDLDLELAGWHVVRLSWWQVVEEPGRVAALMRARLGSAPSVPFAAA
jgi:very-short-patch-repair endonuclease